MSVYAGANNIQSGLVLHLDAFNKKSYPGTGTNIIDLSGVGNNGTLSNSASFTNNSFYINQTDANINLQSNASIADFYKNNTSLTLEVLINKTSITSATSGYNLGFVLFNNNDSGWVPGWSVVIRNAIANNNDILFQIGYNSVSDSRYICPFGALDDTWVHICVTHSVISGNSSARFYKNGLLLNSYSGTISNFSSSVSYPGRIGRNTGISYQGHNCAGYISCYRIYNRVLTPVEVFQNYSTVRGRYGL